MLRKNKIQMKNILQLSFLTIGISLSNSIGAQEVIKKDLDTVSYKQETPKETVKQERAESIKGAKSSKSINDAKNDTIGSTKMSIKEQGIPKRNKNKKSASYTPAATEPPKKNNNSNY